MLYLFPACVALVTLVTPTLSIGRQLAGPQSSHSYVLTFATKSTSLLVNTEPWNRCSQIFPELSRAEVVQIVRLTEALP